MKTETRNKLIEAQQYCDNEDKSTEYMLQYMQDYAGVDLDCVLNFLEKRDDNNHKYCVDTHQAD